MFPKILLLLLIQFLSLGLGQEETFVNEENHPGKLEALENLLDVLDNCWSHKAKIVAFPHPLTERLLSDLVQYGKDGVVFLATSAVDDLAFLSNLAREREGTFVLLGEFNELYSLIKANYQEVVDSSNKITWALPEDMKSILDLRNTRFDGLQLFFTNEHQSDVIIHEIFGYKGEEISWNPVGSKINSSHCLCNRIGAKHLRRQKILDGKVLHFGSVTPNFKAVEDILAMTNDVEIYSPSVIMRNILTEVALKTHLIIQETNYYDVNPSVDKTDAWWKVLELVKQNNFIDIIAESYGHRRDILKIADFTKSAYFDTLIFITRRKDSPKITTTADFIGLFSPQLWLAIFLSTMLIGICMTIFEFVPSRDSPVISFRSIFYSLFYWWCTLFLVLLQRGSFTFSSNIRLELKSSVAKFLRQIILLIASFLFLIIFSLFASNLATVLTTAPTHNSFFRELNDILAPGVEIRMLYRLHPTFFKNAKKTSVWEDIYQKKLAGLNDSAILGSAIAAREFLYSNDQGIVFGIIVLENFATFANLEIERHKQNAKTFGLSMPVRKNWELAEMLDYYVIKLAEAGVVDKLKKQWLGSNIFDVNYQKNDKNLKAKTITFQSVSFLFYGISIAGFCSLCLLIMEILHDKYYKKRLNGANNRTWPIVE